MGVQIPGTDYELEVTIKNTRALNGKYGGLLNAVAHLRNFDVDTIADVILLGSGRRLNSADRDKVIDEFFAIDDQGEVIVACIEFVDSMTRGGRPKPTKDEDAGDDSGNA